MLQPSSCALRGAVLVPLLVFSTLTQADSGALDWDTGSPAPTASDSGIGDSGVIPPAACPPHEVLDCLDQCMPASWIGDGFCDDGTNPYFLADFLCDEAAFDGGDCSWAEVPRWEFERHQEVVFSGLGWWSSDVGELATHDTTEVAVNALGAWGDCMPFLAIELLEVPASGAPFLVQSSVIDAWGCTTLTAQVPPGTYHIRVSATDGAPVDAYTLTVDNWVALHPAAPAALDLEPAPAW